MAKSKKPRRVPPRPAQTTSYPYYKTVCDNHPDRRAAYAFQEAGTGRDVGLCQECFDRKRRIALKKLRIKRVQDENRRK